MVFKISQTFCGDFICGGCFKKLRIWWNMVASLKQVLITKTESLRWALPQVCVGEYSGHVISYYDWTILHRICCDKVLVLPHGRGNSLLMTLYLEFYHVLHEIHVIQRNVNNDNKHNRITQTHNARPHISFEADLEVWTCSIHAAGPKKLLPKLTCVPYFALFWCCFQPEEFLPPPPEEPKEETAWERGLRHAKEVSKGDLYVIICAHKVH